MPVLSSQIQLFGKVIFTHNSVWHQNATQQAVAQMPQISRPHPLHLTTICQLTENGINEIAHSTQDLAVIGGGFGGVSEAKWGLQENAFRAQKGLHIGQPIVAVSQDYTGCAFQHKRNDLSIGFIGWCQKQVGEHARPTQLGMQAKPIKRLSIRMIFPIAGLPSEANTPGCSCKAADRNGNTVHDGQAWVVGEHRVAQEAPQAFFERPQIGRLSHKGGPMQVHKCRKEVAIMTLEVGKQSLILAQTQVTSHDFHRDHFAIGQLGGGPRVRKR
jgi:hypothetical protein